MIDFPTPTNPAFVAWYRERRKTTQQAIDRRWADTATDPSIRHDHARALYARLVLLIEYCAAKHGYSR